MLSFKQEGIKYHFLSLWYDSNWDWTSVSRVIGEHSTINPMGLLNTIHQISVPVQACTVNTWQVTRRQQLQR